MGHTSLPVIGLYSILYSFPDNKAFAMCDHCITGFWNKKPILSLQLTRVHIAMFIGKIAVTKFSTFHLN